MITQSVSLTGTYSPIRYKLLKVPINLNEIYVYIPMQNFMPFCCKKIKSVFKNKIAHIFQVRLSQSVRETQTKSQTNYFYSQLTDKQSLRAAVINIL